MKGVLIASGVLALTGAALGANSTCTRLTDASASLYMAIPYIADKESDLANLPLYELMAPVDKEMPWLSTCLGSADVLSVGLGLLSNPDASKCMSALSGTGGISIISTNGTKDPFASSLCPMMNTTLFPCVDTMLVKAVNDLIKSGGECCNDMATKMPELLGQDLKSFLSSLMVRIADVLCSVKTWVDPTTGEKKTETCGANLIGIVINVEGLENLIQMLKIPNDQACAAMKGENFTSTSGESFNFFEGQETLDSCFAPMNLLFTDLAKLPMIATSDLSPAFEADKCLKGEDILDWSLDEKGLVQGFADAFDGIVSEMKLATEGQVTTTMRAGFEDMKKDFGPMCFHLANSVDDCVYDTSVAYAFSKDTPPPTVGSGGDGSPGASSAALLPSAHIGAVFTSIVVVAASVWHALF